MPSRETRVAETAPGITRDTAQVTASEAPLIVQTAPNAIHAPAYEAAENVTVENLDEPPAPTIDDVLRRLIFHEDRPIENLPNMVSPELKLIGRCVSFRVKQTINGITAPYYYTGLVAMVTDTTVTLMYVSRYTSVDFKLYQSREHRISDFISDAGYQALLQRGEMGICQQDGLQHGRAACPRNDVRSEAKSSSTGQVEEAETWDIVAAFLSRPNPAGSLAPALSLSLEPASKARAACTVEGRTGEPPNTQSAPTSSTRPPYFRNCAESLGILPFVTFLRANVHDVAFGRDPSSGFYALLTTPTKRLVDTQFLRMFVRRYLVHTSEHNNPSQVPIYLYLTALGGCPHLDRGLVNRLVREELPRLMHADCAIAKEKRKLRLREARLSAAIQEYRAPQGLFVNTGVLFLTQIPQHTFMCGCATLFLTVCFVVFLAIFFVSMEDRLIRLFVARLMSCFVPSIMVWAMTGTLTLLHSTSMRVPLRQNIEVLVARAALSVGSVVFATISISRISHSMSNERIYDHLYRQRHSSLCAFYDRHHCSGFYYSCDEGASNNSLCNSCAIHYPGTECFVAIWSRLQFATMPLLLLSVFILLCSANALMMLVKLCLLFRSLSEAATS
ncbi:hypothetical protein ABL78_7867 [Leptomonas seymouri]|uniref:Uncharacterized protein n=1 Tax=Leptomonas seymouri TaxID=5684 RepID=A0A0N0P2M1_LEPSE|nr:hypothetical protein ABL78_7867 [Leptomonas seymouri]|eukprot:KPI83109.1 hypothetical protein ABL78_7867 [Leptomonas seymouri]